MKSDWLPTMPIHAANWLADPRIRMLTPAKRCALIEALLQSWMLGEPGAVNPAIKTVFETNWAQYSAIRSEMTAAYEKRTEQRKDAANARWSDAGRMRAASGPQCGTEGTPTPTPTPAASAKQKRSAPKRGNDTWLTPFGDAWRARYGGELAWSRAGSAFSPLREEHGAERVLRAWVRYVAATEAQFASPQRFASTFGQWDGTAPPAERPIDARGAARQNVPAPLPPDPEFRARYDESMRRRHASQSRLEPRRATNAPNPTTDDPWADDAPLIEDCKDCMEA